MIQIFKAPAQSPLHSLRCASALLLLMLLPSGCLPFKQARVAAVGLTLQDVAKATAKQSDVTLFREGTPAYLMLVDGLIEAYPDNKQLLLAGSQAYSSYASALPDDSESQEEAKLLYRKARDYGFRALSALGRGDFAAAASGSVDDFTALLARYTKKDVPELFWTTSAWASWISSNLNSVQAVADLPMIEASMARVLELDDTFYYGSPHLLLAVYLAAKPPILGGDLAKAKAHFDRAFALGADQLLMAKVYYAQYYARGMQDRNLFVNTLREVLVAPADRVPDLTLANTIAKKKAQSLLDQTEELFQAPL